MNKLIRNFFCLLAILTLSATVSCGSSSSTNGGGGSAGTGDSADLSTADFPEVGICDTGSTDVTESTFLDALGNMVQFTFMHLPYGGNASIPFLCGKEGVWDPTDPNAFSEPKTISATESIADLINGNFGSVLICNAGFNFADFNFGLHDASTFRGELKWIDGGTTYRIRVRFTISGDDAGKTLADLGISASDLKLQDADGNDLDTIADVLQLFVDNPGSVTVKVVSDSTVHITALGRVICWDTE